MDIAVNERVPAPEVLIAEGDRHRDSGRHIEAASAYRRVLHFYPEYTAIWVQLGNMLKDSRQIEEAVNAYTIGLEKGTPSSDTYVQLGRAHRLAGRREDALQAFSTALRLDSTCSDAVRELVTLGENWKAQSLTQLGAVGIIQAVSLLEDMKCKLTRIEQSLPLIENLSSIPMSEWNLWRKLWRYPAPPPCSEPIVFISCMMDEALPAADFSIRSILDQRHPHVRGALFANGPLAAKLVSGYAAKRADRLTMIAQLDTADRNPLAHLEQALTGGHLADARWLVLCRQPLRFHEDAAGWMAATVVKTSSEALFCDEDAVCEISLTEGEPIFSEPWLKGQPDPELLERQPGCGNLILVRQSALKQALQTMGSIASPPADPERWWLALQAQFLEAGRTGTIQKVLASRIREANHGILAAPKPHRVPAHPRLASGGEAPLIEVIIPTKDNSALLEKCLSSLTRTADAARALALTVVDNGSTDPGTLHYLADGERAGRFCVRSYPGVFNWSRINNEAAAASRAPILVFANNDIEMLSHSWDSRLRSLLEKPDIGAIGARLIYPDGTLQHGGIVLGVGPNGAEHEGRHAAPGDNGPQNRWGTRRTVSAVTGAFLACNSEVHRRVGGFNCADFDIWFNDVDFCLTLTSAGLRTLYEPAIEAVHHESKTMSSELNNAANSTLFLSAAALAQKKWGLTSYHDRYYNDHFTKWGSPWQWLRHPR